jgi:adenylate cyclase
MGRSMSEGRLQRRLAAIISADVVGYSRMMGRDEAATLARLKALRAELLEPKVAEYGGRVVKTTGDGLLIEFPSAVDAVSHSVEVQRAMAERNAGSPEEEQIRLRIGINVGDIIIDDEDIYGDGVNVAARLEALAEPGGICVSARVYDYIRDRLNVEIDDLGRKSVKNIVDPVHVYQVRMGKGPKDPAATPGGAREAPPGPEQPTVAVLPFANMSTDPELAFFADGLTEDLTTALCRVPELLVIARESSTQYRDNSKPLRQIAQELGARYLVQGGVRGSGARLRVTAQLVDASTGNYVWSDRYDRAGEDVFAVQDDIVKRVLVEMQVTLTAGEAARVSSRGTESLEAWLHHTRGWNELMNWSREGTLKALDHFQAAVDADPDWGVPLMALGVTIRELAVRGWGGYTEDDFARGLRLVEQAAEMTTDDPFVTSQLGEYYILMGRLEEGIPICEKALAQAPSDSRILGSVAMNFIRAGLYERALGLYDRLRQVSPRPDRFNLANEGLALHMLGRYEEAARALGEEGIVDASVRLAALEVDRGNVDAARALIARVVKSNPGATIGEFAGRLIFTDPKRSAWYSDLLRRAGLPER